MERARWEVWWRSGRVLTRRALASDDWREAAEHAGAWGLLLLDTRSGQLYRVTLDPTGSHDHGEETVGYVKGRIIYHPWYER